MKWKEWPTDPRYLVSDQGQVIGLRGRQLSPGPCGQGGYRKVSTSPNPNQRVDYMVLEAFVGPRPEGCEVCHANDVQSDNRLANLSWGTHVKNCQDRKANGKQHVPIKYNRKRIQDLFSQGASLSEIIALTGISRTTLWRIRKTLQETK